MNFYFQFWSLLPFPEWWMLQCPVESCFQFWSLLPRRVNVTGKLVDGKTAFIASNSDRCYQNSPWKRYYQAFCSSNSDRCYLEQNLWAEGLVQLLPILIVVTSVNSWNSYPRNPFFILPILIVVTSLLAFALIRFVIRVIRFQFWSLLP